VAESFCCCRRPQPSQKDSAKNDFAEITFVRFVTFAVKNSPANGRQCEPQNIEQGTPNLSQFCGSEVGPFRAGGWRNL
jgi:hypothetical protein